MNDEVRTGPTLLCTSAAHHVMGTLWSRWEVFTDAEGSSGDAWA